MWCSWHDVDISSVPGVSTVVGVSSVLGIPSVACFLAVFSSHAVFWHLFMLPGILLFMAFKHFPVFTDVTRMKQCFYYLRKFI